MSHHSLRWTVLAGTSALAALLFCVPGAGAQPTGNVVVRIQSPPEGPVSVQAGSGWPFTISLISQDELGMSSAEPGAAFPAFGQTSLLLYEDPDGCPSWASPRTIHRSSFPDCDAAPPWPLDETFLRFTVDVDSPGTPDDAGEAQLRAALADPAGGGPPRLRSFRESSGATVLVPVGPGTGGNRLDGYGYGANDDLPGLVVLSDTGPGLVFDRFFTLASPREARNLAGFFETVTYQLNDAERRTAVTASTLVPPGLFYPVALVDSCVAPVGSSCTRQTLQRVDGGGVEERDGAEERIVTVRAFVVSGVAPQRLSDRDGDGVVAAGDAELAGYTLLSQEAVVRFRQVCDGGCLSAVPFDFDGNGRTFSGGRPAPGSVTLTRVPR